jgi:hypothetical protein
LFAGIAVLSDRRIERGVPAEPMVHVDYVVLGDAEAFGEELSDPGAYRLRRAQKCGAFQGLRPDNGAIYS